MTKEPDERHVEEIWRTYMTTGHIPHWASPSWFESKRLRPIARLLPSDPRCRLCQFPFEGLGGKMARMLLDLHRSKLNPQLCNVCERFANDYQGGAEIETSLLFADVRGSTALAERSSPAEFSKLINRFYQVTTRELFKRNGMVEKLIGDEVTAFFVPGFSGEGHARDAVTAAEQILVATGHRDPAGPWVPVGVGVHTGIAFVGAVTRDDGVSDIVILGDAVNTAARLASEAGPGEVVVSDAAMAKSGYGAQQLERKRLTLKGRTQSIDVRILKITPSE
jgi:adenylate cyclase